VFVVFGEIVARVLRASPVLGDAIVHLLALVR
jgi:hypothetical protein